MPIRLYNYLFLLAIIILVYPVLVLAEDFKDFAELDLEELLNTTVISASKREQKISEAPNAIYVITKEDIKRSGAVDLPDLFRMVPGVDVINVYGNAYGVSARGFNDRFAQRMLVMIDGRTTYVTFFNGVFWENDQVFLEDIERIEVIRGPGATLWGANAVNGVINIITKDPQDEEELMVTGKAGNKEFLEGVSRYSGSLTDKLSVSLTGGYREDDGTRGVNDWRQVPKATGRVKYKLSENATLHFFAGVNESEIGLDDSKFTDSTDANLRHNHQMVKWEQRISDTSQFHLRVSRDYAELHTENKKLSIEGGNSEIEAQHNFALGGKNKIMWGVNYRSTEAQSNIIWSGTDHDDLAGFFLQDELAITDTMNFVAGVKYEENSFTGSDWSPRGCLLYSPWSNHNFRFALSRAYRTPGFFEDSARFIKTLSPPLSALPLALVKGNDQMDPEEMTAFELGYRTTLFKRMGLNLELYYNELEDVIDLLTVRRSIPLVFSYDNAYHAIARGMEVTLDLPVTPWWTLTANYTFQEVENKRANKDVQGTPKHKFNCSSSFTFQNGFSLDTIIHFVDDTRWDGVFEDISVDDYVRLDMRISQKLINDKLELSLAGQNLTDKLHPEFSDGIETYEAERLVYGQITFRY